MASKHWQGTLPGAALYVTEQGHNEQGCLIDNEIISPKAELPRSIFGDGTHLVFSVPAAFSESAGNLKLRAYRDAAANLRAQGADRVWCLAANDLWVMKAWFASETIGSEVAALSDPDLSFTRALGLDICLFDLAMGTRPRPFLMLIRRGSLIHLVVEPPGAFGVTSPDYAALLLKAYLYEGETL
jgi:peroxiredoxin